MNTQKKTSLNLTAVLIPAFILAICGYAAIQFMKPPLFATTLPISPTVSQLQNGDWQAINAEQPGEQINLEDFIVPDKYTVFDFQSEYCPACQQIGPQLIEMTKMRPDIAVRSIDINRPGVEGVDWSSPVCKQHHVSFAPYFIVYGPDRKILTEGRDAYGQVSQFVYHLLN